MINKKHILYIITLLLLLPGCFPTGQEPPCWMRQEEWKLQEVYETFYDVELTDNEIQCLSNYRIAFLNNDEFSHVCRKTPKQTIACHRVTPFRPRMPSIIAFRRTYFFNDDTSILDRRFIAFHELTHHLLHCVEGGPDSNHASGNFEILPFWKDQFDLNTTDPNVPEGLCEVTEHYILE